MREKLKTTFIFFLALFVFSLLFHAPSIAQDLTGKSENSATNVVKEGTRIIISTSGPVKFNSYWLENPPRLAIEFQTRNIVSKIDNEVMVNQGVIKRIVTSYFEEGKNRSLKSLTFELTQRTPYKIWQELDTIILDIQTPPEMVVFPEGGKEVFTKSETKDKIIKRSQTMDATLTKMSSKPPQLETPKVTVQFPKEKVRKNIVWAIVFWFTGLALVSGLGLLFFWLFWRRYRLILDKNMATQEIEKLKSQVAEKNKLLEQEEIVRKIIENTSSAREKEFEQLKLDVKREAKLLEQEEKARKAKEAELLEKEKEAEQVKNSYESLKEILVEKGMAKKLSSPIKDEEELWIPEKSLEKRQFSRLDLSRDFNRTIILRIESQDKSKSIKSFANNISLGGLCFETRHEFKEKEKIALRLFFFGDKVPMMRMQAKVIWNKFDSPVNRYGVSFAELEEEKRIELNHYIESKIAKDGSLKIT
ncbi:MAG: PilZ domain-containing protein [Candidatus Omnitrophota bacterium]|nr:PilZ domain-containing protein [Candidatus Omnitrophota bacterium]